MTECLPDLAKKKLMTNYSILPKYILRIQSFSWLTHHHEGGGRQGEISVQTTCEASTNLWHRGYIVFLGMDQNVVTGFGGTKINLKRYCVVHEPISLQRKNLWRNTCRKEYPYIFTLFEKLAFRYLKGKVGYRLFLHSWSSATVYLSLRCSNIVN